MAMKATSSTRAPRGTKTLTQAFFSAADGIPDAQRDAVVKAALAAIRDQQKDVRDKTKAAKAKSREKVARNAPAPTAPTRTTSKRKVSAQTPAAPAMPPRKAPKPRAKAAAKVELEETDDAEM